MRIVLLAVNDEFAGEMQRFLYATRPEWVVGSVLSTTSIYKKPGLRAALFVLGKSGVRFSLEMFRVKLVRGFVDRKRRSFPERLAREHGVETFLSSNINDAASIAQLRRWEPDLVISTNFSHYIGKTVREGVARHGCWNLHKSLLPHYRGMAPSFHALLEGAREVGATLHLVAKGFDEGDILAQAKVPVTKTDTVYSLNRKTSEAGGRLLASYLKQLDLARFQAAAQPSGDWPNYTYPTPAEVRRFFAKGLKFYAPEPTS